MTSENQVNDLLLSSITTAPHPETAHLYFSLSSDPLFSLTQGVVSEMEGYNYPVEPSSEHQEGRDTVHQPVLNSAIWTSHPDNIPPRRAMSGGEGQNLPLYDPNLDARNQQPFPVLLSPRVDPSAPYSQPTFLPEQVVQLFTIQQQNQLILSQILTSVGDPAFSQEQVARLLLRIQQQNELSLFQIQSSMGNPGQPQYPMTLQSPLHQPSVPQSTERDSVMKLQARIKELERDVQSPEDTPGPSSRQCQNKSHCPRHKDPVQVTSSPAQESYVSHRSPANLGSRRSPGLINPISPTGPLQNKRLSGQDSKTSSRNVKGESSSERILIPKTSVQSSQPTSSRKRSPSPLDPELLPSTKKTADRKAVKSEKSLDEMLEKVNRYRDELRFLRKHKKRLLRLVVAQLRECRALRYMLSKAEAELEKDPDTADVRSILGPRIPSTQISDYFKMETDVEESSGEE